MFIKTGKQERVLNIEDHFAGKLCERVQFDQVLLNKPKVLYQQEGVKKLVSTKIQIKPSPFSFSLLQKNVTSTIDICIILSQNSFIIIKIKIQSFDFSFVFMGNLLKEKMETICSTSRPPRKLRFWSELSACVQTNVVHALLDYCYYTS